MNPRMLAAIALALSAATLGGCASDGSLALTTGSLQQEAAKAPRIDPACVALMARIEELRKEGTPERLEKVSAGKGATVSVKRQSLARMTELDKANTEFQNKCSTLAATPAAVPAQAAAPVAAGVVAAAAPAVASVAAATAKVAEAKAAAKATVAKASAAATAAPKP